MAATPAAFFSRRLIVPAKKNHGHARPGPQRTECSESGSFAQRLRYTVHLAQTCICNRDASRLAGCMQRQPCNLLALPRRCPAASLVPPPTHLGSALPAPQSPAAGSLCACGRCRTHTPPPCTPLHPERARAPPPLQGRGKAGSLPSACGRCIFQGGSPSHHLLQLAAAACRAGRQLISARAPLRVAHCHCMDVDHPPSSADTASTLPLSAASISGLTPPAPW